VNLSGSEAQDAFAAGNIGMFLQTSAVQGGLMTAAEGKWDLRTTGMPRFGDQPAVPTNSGSGLAVLAQDPAKQRAAWELVKFLTSDYAFTVIARDIGYLPLRPAILEDERYLKDWIAENPQIVPNLEQLAYLEPSVAFPGPNHVQIRDIYLKAQEEVLLFGADPTTTMRAAQERAMELMP
jgi:multiple sugar transport system substrate-binding protein